MLAVHLQIRLVNRSANLKCHLHPCHSPCALDALIRESGIPPSEEQGTVNENRRPVRADALSEVSRDIRPKARARRYPREQRRRRACRTAPPSWRPRVHQLDVRVIGLDRTDVRAEASERLIV